MKKYSVYFNSMELGTKDVWEERLYFYATSWTDASKMFRDAVGIKSINDSRLAYVDIREV